MPDCNADTQANSLYTSLTADAPTPPVIDLTGSEYSFTADPLSPLYADVSDVTLPDLTEVDLEGDGVFDKLMAAVDLHINREFQDARLTGDQYAEVYAASINSVLGQATNFLLNRDQAKWSAIKAQMDARVAEINATEALITLERSRAETAKMIFEMQNAAAAYGLTKMQIANADAMYCLTQAQTERESFTVDNIMPIERDIQQFQLDTALPAKAGIDKFQLEELFPVTLAQEQHKLGCTLPLQSELLEEQVEAQRGQTLETRRDGRTPIGGIVLAQREVLESQKASADVDIESKQYNLTNTLPIQLDLVKEQREAERAKTLDTRSDNTAISGSVGKQKELYDEQISSFDKDAKYKTAKMYLDAWITQKTIDEGLTAPVELQNQAINEVIYRVRAANGLQV